MEDWTDFSWGEEKLKANAGDTLNIETRAEKLIVKNESITTVKMKSLKDLCGLPHEGEQYRIVTYKQFNAYALIKLLLENRIIEDLHISFYRINKPTADALIELIESGKIKRASMIICSYFNQTKKPEKWAEELCDYCKEHPANCNFAYLNIHAKVVAAKTSNGEMFVFEGSGNMTDNANVEQYVYEQNEKVYNFHCEWMDELIRKYEKL